MIHDSDSIRESGAIVIETPVRVLGNGEAPSKKSSRVLLRMSKVLLRMKGLNVKNSIEQCLLARKSEGRKF